MTPFYSGYGVTLFHADSREILPHLPTESIDLLLTDPPYGIKYRSKSRVLAPDLAKAIQGDEDLNAMRDVLGLVHPLLRPDRHAYLFAAPMRLGEAVDAVAAYWTVKNLLVWDKGNAGSRGDCLAGYSQNWEAIIYAAKGRRPLNLPRPRCVFRYDWQSHRDPVHPTIKPRPLLRWLLQKSAQPGELILDPFAGSGSTLIAAAELGMEAIGIETEERYCEVAARRLASFEK